MIKVLVLSRYNRLGASSRYRTYQYLPFLKVEGILCDVSPLFSDEYLPSRYKKKKPPISPVLRGLLRRLLVCLRCSRYDLIIIEKELLPYVPSFLERWLLSSARAYTLDFDDALFHIYDQHRSSLIRRILGNKYSRLMSNAALITVGNFYIEEYAKRHTKRVEILPTVIDVTKYSVTPESKGIFTIGWIGTPITQKYLQMILKPLKRFFEQRKGRLFAIGANNTLKLEGVPLKIVPWSEEKEVQLLKNIHVGIMPLPDLSFQRGKSGLKLLQYMASSRPVIASPVGINVEIVTREVGFLADSADAWLSSLLKLADSSDFRTTMGRKGRQVVEEKFNLERWAPRYAQLLKDAASHKSLGS